MRVRTHEVMPRTFEAGPWRLRMGLSRLDPAAWLWVSEHYAAEIAEKRRLWTSGADVVARMPDAEAAVEEGALLIGDYLALHHPELAGAGGEADPLLRAGLAVQEDLCWLLPGAKGHRLVAAFVAFPARWRLADKIGLPLAAIHAPVPGFAERLEGPSERALAQLAADGSLERANWSLVDDPALHQPGGEARPGPPAVTPEEASTRFHLRIERQTFRRLPRTRAVLFAIHTIQRPLADVVCEGGAAGALRARLAEMPEAMLAYKQLSGDRAALEAYLARCAVGA